MNKKSKIIIAVRILIALMATFLIGNGIAYYDTKEKIYAEADRVAAKDVDNILLYTDKLLGECQASAYNFNGLIGYETMQSEALYERLEQFLCYNPHLYGVVVAFEPDMIESHHIAVPADFLHGNKKDGFQHIRIDSLYDYTKYEWYKHTKACNHANWGEPLRASDGKLIAPFCIPLHTKDNKFLGVMCADISLEGLSKKLIEAAPFPDATICMLDKNLKFIAHPNQDYVLNMTLDSLYRTISSGANIQIYKDMKEGKRSSHSFSVNGNKHIVYYAPIEKANWTIAIDCTHDNIYSQVDIVKRNMLLTMIFGMVIFSFVCWKLIQRIEQYEQVATQRALMKRELTIASKIQMEMIPDNQASPEHKELDVYGFIKTAKSVGGDFYDYFTRDDKFFFCLGDVSGKGVPASLFMAVIHALFRNVSRHISNPSEIVKTLNIGLSERNEMNMFCTMFVGALDLKTGHLDFCNAGHNAPIICRKKEDGSNDIHFMKPKTNIAIGVDGDFDYQVEDTVFHPGDSIFLYTDGISEAENINHEMFGDNATLKTFTRAKACAHSAQDVVKYIYNTIAKYTTNAEQSDDITMLMVEYTSNMNQRPCES